LFEVAASPVFEDVELVISPQDAAMPGTKECIFIEVISYWISDRAAPFR
jgi:hypothetical protein